MCEACHHVVAHPAAPPWRALAQTIRSVTAKFSEPWASNDDENADEQQLGSNIVDMASMNAAHRVKVEKQLGNLRKEYDRARMCVAEKVRYALDQACGAARVAALGCVLSVCCFSCD